MNQIRKLLDPAFVAELFRREVLPHYPAFSAISRVEIKPYKELIWDTTYHVVICFMTYFRKPSGAEAKIPIFCSAHSSEDRLDIYRTLRYLWSVGFPTKTIDLPDPLFYSPEFRGTFYRGLRGENLLHYIKTQNLAIVAEMVASSARLFARLHSLPAPAEADFNPANARLATVMPGTAKVFAEMAGRYPGKYDADLRRIYAGLIAREDSFLASGAPLTLIHGDAHPENILRTARDRVGLIDFTDFCRGDFARDLGSFRQQLEYKIMRKTGDAAYAAKLKDLFLSEYLRASGRVLTPDLEARINMYYHWTALRTAIFWFVKFEPNEERGAELLAKVKAGLPL